jgi:hypothetical protein
MRYRITVRGEGIELRGYFDPKDMQQFYDFAEDMEPYGLVVSSETADDYNPFNQQPILAESGLTGRVYIVTAYTMTGSGNVIAHTKHDVTEQFEQITSKRAKHGGSDSDLDPAGL